MTETLNGEYELTLVHPIDENSKWTRFCEDNILRAPVPTAMTPQVGLPIIFFRKCGRFSGGDYANGDIGKNGC